MESISRPKIVALDGYTLAPAEPQETAGAAEGGIGVPRSGRDSLDWSRFEELGPLTVYDRTPAEEVITRAAVAAAVLVNKCAMTAQVIGALPELRYIGVLATGVNGIDLKAAKAHNVTVTNIPGYGVDSVAQHTIALLLELAGQVAAHSRAVHQGVWTRSPDWSISVAPITELAGKTLGVVGVGSIGGKVAEIAAAMGMRIIASKQQRSKRDMPVKGVKIDWVDLEVLFSTADAVTLHCPLTEKTLHLVDEGKLSRMKPTAWLINTSRGALIDESALSRALRQGKIGGAGLDVLSVEPPPADHPLLSAPNCVITPHVAWASAEAKRRLMGIAVENLRAFLSGKPVNVVGS